MITVSLDLAPERNLSEHVKKRFLIWTILWWTGVGVLGLLFFLGNLDFLSSTKISLYGISIWLNACLLAFVGAKYDGRSREQLLHDALVVWMLCYAVTNITWEIPWVIFSPFIFENIHTIEDVVSYTEFMRESFLNMYWWILASFASIDLRTVNHDGTFYTIELFAFSNLAMTLYFFYLNKKRSRHRYLVPMIGCGEPIAATIIFSFSEVFDNFENMPGGIADTLLALVWTQYQYILYPLIFGYIAYQLLLSDLKASQE